MLAELRRVATTAVPHPVSRRALSYRKVRSFNGVLPFVARRRVFLPLAALEGEWVVCSLTPILFNEKRIRTEIQVSLHSQQLPLTVDGLFSIEILIKSVFSTPARQATSPNVSPRETFANQSVLFSADGSSCLYLTRQCEMHE